MKAEIWLATHFTFFIKLVGVYIRSAFMLLQDGMRRWQVTTGSYK